MKEYELFGFWSIHSNRITSQNIKSKLVVLAGYMSACGHWCNGNADLLLIPETNFFEGLYISILLYSENICKYFSSHVTKIT